MCPEFYIYIFIRLVSKTQYMSKTSSTVQQDIFKAQHEMSKINGITTKLPSINLKKLDEGLQHFFLGLRPGS